MTTDVEAKPTAHLINPRMKAKRERLHQALRDLHGLMVRHLPERARQAEDLLGEIGGPFRFVVIGEVNAGKSSAINALLEAPVCPTGHLPTTNTINEICYADPPFERVRGDVREVGAAVPLLRDVCIVDTPGTGSKYEHHDQLTLEYVHKSDLVLFAFSLINPHLRSGLELLRHLHKDWSRPLVFLLLQADRASPQERRGNQEAVLANAHELGLRDTRAFVLSAPEGGDTRTAEGFDALRAFIRDHVTGGRRYSEKLANLCRTAETLCAATERALAEKAEALKDEETQQGALRGDQERLRERAQQGLRDLLQQVDRRYQAIAGGAEEEFAKGFTSGGILGRSLSGILNEEKGQRAWLEQIQRRFEGEVKEELGRVAEQETQRIYETQRELMHGLVERLRQGQTRHAMNLQAQTDTTRQRILQEVEKRLKDLQGGLGRGARMDANEVARPVQDLLLGGGAAAAGGLLMWATALAPLDVTGGALVALGTLGGLAVFKWRQGAVRREFAASLQAAGKRVQEDLKDHVSRHLKALHDGVAAALEPLVQDTRTQASQIADAQAEQRQLRDRLAEIARDAAPGE